MRKTKAFSYDSKDQIVFDKLSKASKAQKPKTNESQMLIYILNKYFETEKMLADITAGRARR